jgi:histidinol-phosphate aminotransferase
MSVSRRGFVRTVIGGRGAAAELFLAARGHEDWSAEHRWSDQAATSAARKSATGIRLNSNENPLGPSDAAKAAIERAFAYAGRYPMNARPAMADFRALVAKRHGVKVEAVSLGAGSGEILENAVQAFTTSARGLVAALPTFEAPSRTARERNVPINEVPVEADGKLDLEKMIAASSGAGLVFVCNPNNPTATVHSGRAIADLVGRIRKMSPETIVLVDEAYHDYVMAPSYSTAIPLIADNPALIVSRTMSKLHGMAGMRLGYAIGHPDAIERLSRWSMPYNGNALAVAAAFVSIEDSSQIERERRRNVEALKFTTEFFRGAGFSVTDSQANFVWVNLNRPAKEFREACEKQGILVGRDFPPLEKTHCRISVGTMDEMRRAVAVFRSVLGVTTTTAQRRQGA